MKRHQAKLGFTLVELLVVVGIIAVLIGVLLPALIASRRRALIVKCLGTERQIAQAAMIQALWHHGYVQLGGLQWIPSTTGPGWASVMPETVGDPYATRYAYFDDGGTRRPMPFFASCAQTMNVHLDASSRASLQASLLTGDALRAFVCPSQSAVYPGTSVCDALDWTSPPEMAGYLLNEEVLAFRTRTANTPHGRLDLVHRPSDVMLFGDGNPRKRQFLPLFSVWGSSPTDTLSNYASYDAFFNQFLSLDYVRHNGFINVAFCDGHASTFDMGTQDRRSLGNISAVLIGTGM